MAEKTFPLIRAELEELCKTHPTPFYLYDESGIRQTAIYLDRSFTDLAGNGVARTLPGGYRNYFAVKACPNPHILKILAEEGMGADCSSVPELHLAKAVGLKGEDIMFTSNNTSREAFKEAHRLGAVINLDDIRFIDYLKGSLGKLPELLCFRYNPGEAMTTKAGNPIGNPKDAKYGLTPDQIVEAYKTARNMGVKRFGLHAMIASNERDSGAHVATAEMMFSLAAKLKKELDISFEFINLGGGFGIPYRPEENPINLERVAEGYVESYDRNIGKNRLSPVKVLTECGRYVTGPNGWVVSKVRHVMDKHKKVVGVDAPANALFRAAIYSSAYHHMLVPGKQDRAHYQEYDVVSGLCENVAFAKDRLLPEMKPGDFVIMCDAGAHGHAMGNNYNAELRIPELLLKPDHSIQVIRRGETEKDLFSTFDFKGSKYSRLAK